MSLRLFMDHHVPQAITRGLRGKGIDCLTAAEDGSQRLADPELLERASTLGRVLFSMDDDLLTIAAEWLTKGHHFAGIVYAHPLRITIGQAVRDLELIARSVEAEEMAGRIEYLPL